MQTFCTGIFFPYIKIRFNINPFDTIQGDDVKFSGRFVIFNRISGCSDDPAGRNGMGTKRFILQKLQHCWNQSFRNTVDLVDKKNSFLASGLFDFFINRGNDFTHGVFCYGIFSALEVLFYDYGQSDSTLASMMGDRVGDKVDSTFSGSLFHDRCFSDTGRTDQEERTLTDSRHKKAAFCVFVCINLYGMEKFLFCIFDIHRNVSSFLCQHDSSMYSLQAQTGTFW